MYQLAPLLALIILFQGYINAQTPTKLTLKEEKKVTQLLELAQHAVQKANHTFAGELITLQKLKKNKHDKKIYLIECHKIYKNIKTRYKKHKGNLEWDEFSNTINILLWGVASINNPFSHYCKLINFVLKDLNKRKKKLHFATRTIHQSVPLRQKSISTINEINTLFQKITDLKAVVTNYEYEFECYQISKLTASNIICIGIIIAIKTKPFIFKARET